MDKKIPCDACGHCLDEVYMHKNENGKIYCMTCEVLINSNEDLDRIEPGSIEPVSQEELENNIRILLNTPPLTWKDLKEKLKKEREEQRKFFKEKKKKES